MLGLAGQAEVGLGEGSVVAAVDRGLERGQGGGAGGCSRGPGLAEAKLEGVEPEGVGGAALGPLSQEA